MKSFISFLFSLGLFCFSGCAEENSQLLHDMNIINESISAEEFQILLQNPEYHVIDIRTPEETAQGKILKNAQEIDFYANDFHANLAGLEKSKKYLLYCNSDRRTGLARKQMKKMGFISVQDLDGGISNWVRKGFPLNQ